MVSQFGSTLRSIVRVLVPTTSIAVPAVALSSGAEASSSSKGAVNGWPPMSVGSAPRVVRRADGAVESVRTALNYQHPSVRLVWSARDEAGSDDALHGAQWAVADVDIRNGRLREDDADGNTGPPSRVKSVARLAVNGFELRADPKRTHVDYRNTAEVVGTYYKECEALVKEATGAQKVIAFDHNVRSPKGAGTETLKGSHTAVQPPAAIVHADYTATSAPRRIQQLGAAPKVNDVKQHDALLTADEAAAATGKTGRFAIINVWRGITPVRERPLAFCDAATVEADDLLTFEIRYADRVGENFFARPNAKHDWVYFPDMMPDEAVLLKTWDSGVSWDAQRRKEGSQFVLHSAFLDPSSSPDAPPRESIEVRCAVIY